MKVRQLITFLESWDGHVDVNDGEFLLAMNEELRYCIIKSKTLDLLQRDRDKLSCLEEFGVDNWDGYGDAMSAFKDIK